jgi:hypothetical protein
MANIIYPPKPGETWYVKLNGKGKLQTARINDFTARTVVLTTGLFARQVRYAQDDVKFVEPIARQWR